jgi:hypothetical protein
VFITYDPVASYNALMYNSHSDKSKGLSYEAVFDAFNSGNRNFSIVSKFTQLVNDITGRPTTILAYSLIPIESPLNITGIGTIKQTWDLTLLQ